ncbi:MAG: type II toxin-antitoxin system VapC family toxin [Candidatus Verstraetearchaeota archaeon]|nr:type II toxin-antitoxin system VapC family toxin [Candidatus Verstraetearchaeota archaeon]
MSYIFDASALLNLIRKAGSNAIEIVKENYILDLTLYEIGNALWKEAILLKRISLEEALKTISFIENLRKILIAKSLSDEDLLPKVLKISLQQKITYYDAAYITIAQNQKLTLIADDSKLIKTAKKLGVKTKTSSILIKAQSN